MPHSFFESAPHFRPYRWAAPDFQVGLQPIHPRDWLILDDNYAAFMSSKKRHLTACADRCYRTLASSLAAQAELRELVLSHLLEQHPGRFTTAEDALRGAADGASADESAAALEPLWQLSHLVQEDFMLLEEVAGRQCITAASNAYSSSGRLVGSVGKDVRWAHEHVPDLTKMHGARIDRILATIHPDFISARFNWLLTPLTSIFFPADPHQANLSAMRSVRAQLSRDPALAGSLLHMRVERQTLRRLPVTGAVAFSIHTYSDPLVSLVADEAAVSALIELLTHYSPARLQYSEMGEIRDAAIAWLRANGSVRAALAERPQRSDRE